MLASEKVQGQVGLGVAGGQESRNRTREMNALGRSGVNGWAWDGYGKEQGTVGRTCVCQAGSRKDELETLRDVFRK